MIYGITDCDPSSAPTTPAGYMANAVHLAGGNLSYLNIASLSCGTDNGTFSFSFLAKGILTFGTCDLWVTDAGGNYTPFHEINGSNQWIWEFDSVPGSAHVYNRGWNIGGAGSGAWDHFMGSANSNIAGTGAKISSLYINDGLVTPNFTGSDSTAFIVPCNGKQFTFGGDTFGGGPVCDVADVWFGPNIALHDGTGTIPTATRRQFISAIGKPVDPVSWPTSAVQFYGDAAHFTTNHGTGGTFTLTGTLTNASTHP